jgi:hypothetical protein
MADTLDQDVQALKEWLRQAWRYLAQPSVTRFDQKEMRQQMKVVDEKLRIALRKLADKDNAARNARPGHPNLPAPNLRFLKIDA